MTSACYLRLRGWSIPVLSCERQLRVNLSISKNFILQTACNFYIPHTCHHLHHQHGPNNLHPTYPPRPLCLTLGCVKLVWTGFVYTMKVKPSLFLYFQVVALLLGFINLIIMVMVIGASTWVHLDDTRLGLWEECIIVSPGRVDCEPEDPPSKYACCYFIVGNMFLFHNTKKSYGQCIIWM